MKFLSTLFLAMIGSSAPITREIKSFGPSIETVKLDGPFPGLESGSDDDANLVKTLQDMESMAIKALYISFWRVDIILQTISREECVDIHLYASCLKNVLESLVEGLVTEIQSSYLDDNQVSHIYLQQTIQGYPVSNGIGAVHIDADGQIVFITHSFHQPQVRKSLLSMQNNKEDYDDQEQDSYVELESHGLMEKEEALESFANYLGIEIESIQKVDDSNDLKLNEYPQAPVSLKIIQLKKDQLRFVWDIELDLDTNWFSAQIDAITGQVLSLNDWVSHATFHVFPVGLNDPSDGDREMMVDPEHPIASPIGWNAFKSSGGKVMKSKDTQGNNVYAQSNPSGGNEWRKNHRPEMDKNQIFDYPLNLEKQPSTYIDAAIVNLFYWNNIIHDLFYVYGFTESAGNFQINNFGKGGKGNDAVIANAQDGSGTNNANFATPPDGYNGRMRMYIWTATNPNRDGDLESGIVIHEYAHGISTRLTGGPANSNCLGWGEAGGMGEGWGDWFATILRMSSNTTRNDNFGMGAYSASGNGIRKYLYSTSKTTNPSTYAFIRKPGYWGVHAKGEVWAEILYEFFWDLVDTHGWQDDWFNVSFTNATRTPGSSVFPKKLAGNKLALRLVVDGLKLQPCSPTFVDARDAILLADKLGTKGANQCIIWKSFARRGLGVEAEENGREDFTIPSECEQIVNEESK